MGFFTRDKPELKTFQTTQPWQREFGESLSDIFGEAAPEMLKRIFEREGDYREDILADFKIYFATPAMRMWEDVIAPVVTEGFNLPGAFYSRDRFRGVQRAGEEFLTTRVNPLLFSSLETSREGMLGRDLQRQAIIANILTGSQSLATAPTISGVMSPGGPSEFSELAGVIAPAVAGFSLAGGFGGGAGAGSFASFMQSSPSSFPSQYTPSQTWDVNPWSY